MMADRRRHAEDAAVAARGAAVASLPQRDLARDPAAGPDHGHRDRAARRRRDARVCAPRSGWPTVPSRRTSSRLIGCADRASRGQGIVEYGLILSLSALLAVVLLVGFGSTLSAVLQAVGNAIDAAT